MEINDKLVSYVAELAHLKLDDDQRAQAAADLSGMWISLRNWIPTAWSR